jgi:hypothetical protein
MQVSIMRDQIKALMACGISTEKIAMIFDMSTSELYDRFGKEIATAEDEANASVAHSLYKMATSGKHPQASIFWLKSRAGWDDKSDIQINIDHNTPREEIIKRIKELESSSRVH